MRNPISITTTSGLGLMVLLISGCSQSQDAAYVRDDVYDRPDPRTITAAVAEEEKTEPAAEQSDYYNPNEAQRYANPRGYYDMAYNDPYYYGYDRYGFGMSYGSGWGGSMWSSGYGYGNVWGDPYWNGYGGYGNCMSNNGWYNGYGSSWGYGYGSGWNYGYGGYSNGYGCGCGNSWNSPYNYGGYNGYGYYGYGGGCYNCYQPIITCGGEGWGGNTVYSHRPSFGGGTSTGGNGTAAPVGQRMNTRDQIGLIKPLPGRTRPEMSNNSSLIRPAYPASGSQSRVVPIAKPAEHPPIIQRQRDRGERPQPVQHNDNSGTRTIDTDRSTGGGGNTGGRRTR
ncbi:MAG: hypothetical protein WAU70_15115 [Flavobacteriales bacterium]